MGAGSSRWCSAFRSAVDAGDMERGGMGWSGSCGSVGCWWACGFMHFYLSIGLTKSGDNTFSPMEPNTKSGYCVDPLIP